MVINTLITFFNWFLNHLLVFTNLGTLILTIILATKNQYQPFIETKHQQILNDILFPFYETIELQLFQPITEENKVLKLQQINQFIQHTRKHQLFYLLGSSLTSCLLSIESDYIKHPNSDLKTLNNHYYVFSSSYFKLSWSVRRNLKIENNEYHYKRRLYTLTTTEHALYKLHPKQLFPILGFILFFSSYFCFVLWFIVPVSINEKLKLIAFVIVGAGASFLIYIASLLMFLLLKRINDHFKKRTKGITKSN